MIPKSLPWPSAKRATGFIAVGVVTITMAASPTFSAPSVPHLAVSPQGSDMNACTRTAPCKSFQRAYARAHPGQIVDVAPGTYPPQQVSGTKRGRRPVFKLDRRAHVQDLQVHADNFEVRGGKIDDLSVHQDSNGFISRNTDRGVVSVWGAQNVSFIGGDSGPSYDPGGSFESSWISFDTIDKTLKEPSDVVIDGVTFHDYRRPTPEAHTQCLFIVGGNGITIRNSRFIRCDVFAIYIGTPWFGNQLPLVRNVIIENNFFDASTLDGTYGRAFYSVRFAGDWSRLDNVRIAYNSSKQAMSLGNGNTPHSRFMFVGNVIPVDYCFDDVDYRHNVVTNIKCSSTDKLVTNLGFVDPDRMDLRPTSTSPAIDAGDPKIYPRRDIFGRLRPKGRAPDAGAVELR